jgi:hypothetical protein
MRRIGVFLWFMALFLAGLTGGSVVRVLKAECQCCPTCRPDGDPVGRKGGRHECDPNFQAQCACTLVNGVPKYRPGYCRTDHCLMCSNESGGSLWMTCYGDQQECQSNQSEYNTCTGCP